MKKFASLIGIVVLALNLGTVRSWAVNSGIVNNTAYVDPEFGTDSATCGGELLGPSFTDTATGPCATLNQALQNLPTTGGAVVIERGGIFGPIYLTAPINITGPADHSAIVQWNASTLPGCLGGAPGSCNSSANANYAVEVMAPQSGASVKFKNLVMNTASGPSGAVHLGNAFAVQFTDVVLRGGTSLTAPQIMLVDPSSQGYQMQVLLEHCDVGVSFMPGGAIVVAPSGNTPIRMDLNHTIVHNATFGLQANSTALTGTANIQILADDTQFFSFNNSAVSMTSNSPGPNSPNGAAISITRSAVGNTGGAGFRANGMGAGGLIYESAILGNATGVNVLNGAGVFTFQNNEIAFNGIDCAVNSVGTSCSSALTQQSLR